MITTALSAAERVAAGAAWLDEHRPGWVDKIRITRLDLSSCTQCVLGQVYGHYFDAVSPDEATTTARPLRDADAAALGFEHRVDARNSAAVREDYAWLARAWRTLIRERRAAGKVSAS